MEDYIIELPDVLGENSFSFFAVLDGHGGHLVSSYI